MNQKLAMTKFKQVVLDPWTQRARLWASPYSMTLAEWKDHLITNGIRFRILRPFGAQKWVYDELDGRAG